MTLGNANKHIYCANTTLTYTLKSKTLTPLAKATNSDVLLNASEYTGLREFIPA